MFTIENEINKIPKSSKLIKEIKKLYCSKTYDDKKLIFLIESNTFLKTEFLKIANSKHLGFESSVDTVSRAVHLYGMNFSLAYALFLSLLNELRFDLDLYDCSFTKFMYLNELSLFTLFTWLEEKELELQEKVIFPLLASNLGKLISSKLLKQNYEDKININNILEDENALASYEEQKLGLSSLDISVRLLEHWSFEDENIALLENLNKVKELDQRELYIMDVIRTLCNFKESFSKTSLEKTFYKADIYSLNIKSLKSAIEVVLKAYKKGL